MASEKCVLVPSNKLKRLILKYESGLFSEESVNAILFQDLKNFMNRIKNDDKDMYIHELLQGSELQLPSPKEKPRNPELEARVQKLKAEQADKEYKRMTENVSLQHRSRGSSISQIGTDVRSVNSQVAEVINFVLTVGGSFLFAYKAVEYSLPQPHIPSQVLLGVLVAVVVAIADLYFLIRNM